LPAPAVQVFYQFAGSDFCIAGRRLVFQFTGEHSPAFLVIDSADHEKNGLSTMAADQF